MPQFAKTFGQRMVEAIALAEAGDLAAATPVGSSLRTEWHPARVELLYELAYLRMFIEWELFLEQTFLRYLCGYACVHGIVSPAIGNFFGTLPQAEAAVLGAQSFVLWHNPDTVIARARRFLTGCPHEAVVSSNRARLLSLAAVRHRIAHGQEDAKQKFDVATMNLSGRRYRGARPGRFLRDWDISAIPARRWLATLGFELRNLTQQIA